MTQPTPERPTRPTVSPEVLELRAEEANRRRHEQAMRAHAEYEAKGLVLRTHAEAHAAAAKSRLLNALTVAVLSGTGLGLGTVVGLVLR